MYKICCKAITLFLAAEATPPQKQAHKPKFEPIRASVNNDTDEDKDEKQGAGGYDPSEFDNLDVSSEVRDLFKYITRYIIIQLHE